MAPRGDFIPARFIISSVSVSVVPGITPTLMVGDRAMVSRAASAAALPDQAEVSPPPAAG